MEPRATTPATSNIDLNAYQKNALNKLNRFGLQEDLFEGCEWFDDHRFVDAMVYLVWGKRMAPIDALGKLKDLTAYQAAAIAKGQSKENIYGLSEIQLRAVSELGHWELIGDHLREQDWFNTRIHIDALEELIVNQFYSIENALLELSKLNEFQLRGIYKHLSIEDMKKLTSEIHVDILVRQKDNGLTANDLVNKPWLNDKLHVEAIEKLTFHEKLTPEQAINEIRGLTLDQLNYMNKHYKRRKDVEGLTKEQIKILENNLLLNAADLRANPWFHQEHCRAYMELHRSREKEETFTILSNLNSEQVIAIEKGRSLSEVEGLTRIQAKAFHQLKWRGISDNHLRGKEWFNSESHFEALERLLGRHVPGETAMKTLEDKTEEELKNIIQNSSSNQLSQHSSMRSTQSKSAPATTSDTTYVSKCTVS